MALPKSLSGLTIYVAGIDYVGVARSFTPPEVEAATMEADQPGHAAPVDVPTHRLSKLTAECVLGDVDPRLERLVGSPAALEVPVHFVGALTDGLQTRSVEWAVTGLWTKQSPGQVGGGGGGGADGVESTYTISPRTLMHRIDGDEVRFVDVEANVHRIDGVDVLQPVRDALRAGSAF